MNKCVLIGRVGKDPIIRYLQDGTAVASLSMATSEKWKDKAGNKQERTEWTNLVVWKKLAEIVEKYVTKGMLIAVEGKLATRKYTGQDDVERWTTEVVVNNLEMLGGGNKGAGTGQAPKATADEFDFIPEIDDGDVPL